MKLYVKFLSVICMLLCIAACMKSEQFAEEIEGEEIVLSLSPSGEILQVTDEPLKADLPAGTLYVISVYNGSTRYAHGVFSDPSAMSIRLSTGKEYSIKVKAVKDGVTQISNAESVFEGNGLLDNTFHYYATDKQDEALYGNTADITSLTDQWTLDTYYGALTVTPTASTSTLAINLYRMMHGINVKVLGFQTGDGSVTFTQASYLPGTESFTLTPTVAEFSTIAVINPDFATVLAAISGESNYTRTSTFTAVYSGTLDGEPYTKTLIDSQSISFIRNRITTITLNLVHIFTDIIATINISVDGDDMGLDDNIFGGNIDSDNLNPFNVLSLYTQFNEWAGVFPSLERHNDFGYPSVIIFMDANGEDMVSSTNGYNWFRDSVDFTSRDYTGLPAELVWGTMYKLIANCNNILAVTDRGTARPDELSAIGQALALRSFCYWVLAQLYAFNYNGHENDACVPLVLDTNQDEYATEGLARNTVTEVYEQINSDIDEAITALDKAKAAGLIRPDKRYINSTVAHGLRARINLTLGNWEEAASAAQNAISLAEAEGCAPYTISEISSSYLFLDASEHSYVWGDVIDESDDVVQSSVCNFSSHMGSMNYGYASYAEGRAISKKLYATIADSDVRKGWWMDANGNSNNLTPEANAYMNENYAEPAYVQVKYGPYKGELGTSTNACDVPLLRVEELYLILAEAQAHDNPSTGLATLQNFVKTFRDPSYAFGATDDTLFDEIFRQRRIELWGEGLNWFDIMRLNKGIDRRGAGFEAGYVFNIPAGDPVLLWRIPQAEIESNGKISESNNNPEASRPLPWA